MRKIKALVILISVMVVSTAWFQAGTHPEEEVSKQIEKLETRIVELEKKIKTLENHFQAITEEIKELPRFFPQLEKIPEDWRLHEFNGIKYYIIPLKSDSKKTKKLLK